MRLPSSFHTFSLLQNELVYAATQRVSREKPTLTPITKMITRIRKQLYPGLTTSDVHVQTHSELRRCHIAFKVEGIFSGISSSPTTRQIKSANLRKRRTPEARFLTVLMKQLMRSPTRLVKLRSTSARML